MQLQNCTYRDYFYRENLVNTAIKTKKQKGGANYRFGFNGKEKDNEIKGEGNSYDFGARIYDPRIGRWLSIDPEFIKFPGISPYNFSYNNPLVFNDPDGKSGRLTVEKYPESKVGSDGKTMISGRVEFETTVFLYGKGATDKLRNDLNNTFNNLGKTAFVKSDQGDIYEITFKVKYELAPDITPDMVKNAPLNRGARDILNLPPNIKTKYNIQAGDNALEVRTQGVNSNAGVEGGAVYPLGNSTGWTTNIVGTVIEETFHQIGFDERHGPIGGMYDQDLSAQHAAMGGTQDVQSIHPVQFYGLYKYSGVNQKPAGYSQDKKYTDNIYSIDNTDTGKMMIDNSQQYEADKAKAVENVKIK